MDEKRKLTDAEREAIAAKYQRRILELGTAVFGPPEVAEGEPASNVLPFPDPNAEKAQELERRIIDATIQLLEAAPPEDEVTPPNRKPGDLHRTAERLRAEEVDLPDPDLDREKAAASFDQHAAFEKQKIAFGREMDAVTLEALEGLVPILEAVKKLALDLFHEVKRWAEEDPEGPAAEYYRELYRAWRQGAGRSRG
jgi:hypothetical protein